MIDTEHALGARMNGTGTVQSLSDTEAARAAAYARLVDRAALDRAYHYATIVLGNRADAEDATHDAALSAWRRLAELRDPQKFDAWFGRILVNACRDLLRARRRLPVAVRVPSNVVPDPSDGIARRAAIAAALRSLSPEHREVIALRFYLDLTVDQIAARTGTREGTVKSRLHYSLARLRASLGEHESTIERVER
jgi:RNA polymerase sigma-70 factor, ECF subfamily